MEGTGRRWRTAAAAIGAGIGLLFATPGFASADNDLARLLELNPGVSAAELEDAARPEAAGAVAALMAFRPHLVHQVEILLLGVGRLVELVFELQGAGHGIQSRRFAVPQVGGDSYSLGPSLPQFLG